ncbi:hypothetical protein NKR23_g2159 [Pleurostoma richardsiae]|uniref:F-box domain-containing protein n=1 Tax=Pleurostoma richardsiae TaxID=41990 RepID=A0AA38RPL5_9PEZI|nr:hypothetical protein NKR23_g2159 [Pleurostoma richardsiae]
MDSLPVELLRLIFQYCDPAAVRNLRLVSGTLAEVGYEYLIQPEFTALAWRDDVKRLHSIASHSRLQGSVESITFNFSEVDEYNARHASYFQHYLQDPEERNGVLGEAWNRYYEAEKRRKQLPTFDSRSAMVRDALKQLPNLSDLSVTFTKCPFHIDVLEHVFDGLPNCRKMDRAQACKNLNLIIAAAQESKLTSFSVDRFPLEILRMPEDRRHWFDCSPAAFASLTSLSLAVDPSSILFPASRYRAVKGLGHIIRFAPNLTSLSLAFHTYGSPRSKFILWFSTLFEGFTFKRLTDLKLEGISCDEEDLRNFLARHGGTLQRLRLGGRGLAKADEGGLGGVHLCRGTFRSLFTSLRSKLPRLESFHMEGDFQCGAPESDSESYSFHAVTDDDWRDVGRGTRPPSAKVGKTRDSLDFERYLLRGGKYPATATAVQAQ